MDISDKLKSFDEFKDAIDYVCDLDREPTSEAKLFIEHYIKIVTSFEQEKDCEECRDYIDSKLNSGSLPINFKFLKNMAFEADRKRTLIEVGYFKDLSEMKMRPIINCV